MGERRQLTVLFCDLVGSTQLSQQLDAEEWRDVLARYQQAASDVVARFGGHVAKNLGDGLLIYFGWPTAREDDPERAVRAGLAIVDALAALGATLSVDNGTRLAVRIGLHTGPAVIADGGEVFGETPNVAARVQSAAEPDTVVITAATQRLVPGIFVLEDRGSQVFKGVREPVPLYRVLQPSGVRSRLDVAAGRLTRFVGREVELATLVDRWERAADGDGQNVLLVGEAGVGKSRLAYQLRERLVAVPHTWLECGASPYTEGTPFHPVVALVAQGLAFTATDKATEKVEKITRGLRDLATPESVNLLADFLGLPPPTPLALNPDVQRRKTMELLAQWNLAISAVQPLVLLVEDLHWCDASSLELLGRIIAQSATARVLFLATTRPEFTSLWPARSNLTTLQLTRLTKRHAREMVTTLLGATVPAETLEALVARADGVPLYVEELTKAVAELGAARGADAIPSTLAGSLMARLDRLATAKEVAQRAAVLGREFSYPLLAAVAGMEEAGLRQGLARLVDAEIVFQRGEPPEATYTFKHALVQEAAYESLLRSTRAQCHRRVGVVLAERFPEIAEGEPELLAQHFHAAGMAAEAVEYWRQAGLKAVQRSPNEASRHLERAVETLGTLPESPERDQLEIELLTALGPALLATRGFTAPEVGRNYERAHDLCRRTGDTPQLFATLWGLWLFNTNQGRLRMAREISERAMGLAQQQGDKGLLLQAHHMLGATLLSLGPLTSSRSHWEAGIALYDPSEHRGHASLYGGHDPGVCCRGFGAHAIWMLGYADLALQRTRDAILLAQTLGQPASLAHALISAAMLHRLRREPHSALDMVQVGLTVSTEHHLALYETSLRFIQGWAMAKTGRENEGIAGIHGARAVLKDAGVTVLFGMSFSGIIAEACLEAGQLEAGLAALDEGLAMAEASGELSFLSELKRLRGELLLEHGGAAAEEAAICLRSALDMARAQEAKSFELRAATSLARLWRDQGKRAEAHELLGPVYAWFTEGFDTRDLIEAKALLDELR